MHTDAINSLPTKNKAINTATNNVVMCCEQLSWSAETKLILNNINLNIIEGSFNGLLGPNGAGKSSLLRCLYRYLSPNTGSVSLFGQDIWQIPATQYAKQVAVVLQESISQFNICVADVVALGLIPHKSMFSLTSDNDKALVAKAIEQVGLTEKSKQSFEHLSGGEKQRVLIARAIVQSPRLLIMDEPTSHLDIKYQIQIMELARSLNITVIASFHDLNLASAVCDNLFVINQGEIVAEGRPTEVITENMLSDVFGVCAHVGEHPQNKSPHITYFYDYNATHTVDTSSRLSPYKLSPYKLPPQTLDKQVGYE
jgi:iron complex transport system ATP-binding protein